LPCALGPTDHPPEAAEEKATDPVVLTTWAQLRRHLRLWLASLFGAPLEAEVQSGLSGDVPHVPYGAGIAEEALVPGQHPGAAECVAALQAVLSKHPTLLADLAQWSSENIVGDPVVEHLSFARMTTTLRKTTRDGLFATITRDPGRPLSHRPRVRARGASACPCPRAGCSRGGRGSRRVPVAAVTTFASACARVKDAAVHMSR
jgi:hypothetical protein